MNLQQREKTKIKDAITEKLKSMIIDNAAELKEWLTMEANDNPTRTKEILELVERIDNIVNVT